ncbi:MAG TPA: hypothetical protein VJR29_03650 [bacterium]|nr:hypothetical protein [bacterium]
MTDPKHVSRNREYYTDQYGNARPVSRESSLNTSYEDSVDIGDEFGSDISTNPNVPDEYQEFFADLPPEQAPNDGQLMNGVNEQVDGSIPPGAGPIQWGPSQIKEEIQDLLKDNKDLLEAAEAYGPFNDQLEELVRQIGRDGADPEALTDQMLELKDNITAALDEIGSSNNERYDAAIRDVESMIDRVEDSDLTDEQRTEWTERLEEKVDSLKDAKRKNEFFGEEATDEMQELQEDLARAMGTSTLIDEFESLPSKIPNKGGAPQYTMKVVRAVRDAMNSGNWSEVNALMDEMDQVTQAGGMAGAIGSQIANDIIQQFVGAIYFGVAGEDENKLDQFLSLIPSDIRQRMANIVTANEDELNHQGGCGTDAERREHYFYGTPQVTADRLLDNDIERAGERIGRSSSAPEPTSSGGD